MVFSLHAWQPAFGFLNGLRKARLLGLLVLMSVLAAWGTVWILCPDVEAAPIAGEHEAHENAAGEHHEHNSHQHCDDHAHPIAVVGENPNTAHAAVLTTVAVILVSTGVTSGPAQTQVPVAEAYPPPPRPYYPSFRPTGPPQAA